MNKDTVTIYDRVKSEIDAIYKRWLAEIGLHSDYEDEVRARQKFNGEMVDALDELPCVTDDDIKMFESLCEYSLFLDCPLLWSNP